MKHVRMLGLCLVAVFAVAAVAATTASAGLPEWGQCYAKAGGKYSDSNCTVKAKKGAGAYEWRKSTEVSESQKKFAGGNVGSGGVLTTEFRECFHGTDNERRVSTKACEEAGGESVDVGTLNVECESESNHGEASGSKDVKNVSVKFLGCKLLGTAPCSNGTNEGEILVNTLKGELGYISKATKEVGLLLEPATKKGEFAKFTCVGALTTVVGVGNIAEGAAYSPEKTGGYDGLISPITPVDTMTRTFTQTYTVNEHLENVPSKFEGKHINLLEDYVFVNENPGESTQWMKAGESITNVNTQVGSEEVEIKA